MSKYHKYVFDLRAKKFVGDFEKMYRAEKVEGFDSWHQDDSRQLARYICSYLFNRYNFNRVLDVGCGKGAFTHLLKKSNNEVFGIDISKTAVKIAGERFPDISFARIDLTNTKLFRQYLRGNKKFDLIFCSETLSYLKNWQNILSEFSASADFCLINLYIPNNPIGFVKSPTILLESFGEKFEIIQHISLRSEQKEILFGKSRISK